MVRLATTRFLMLLLMTPSLVFTHGATTMAHAIDAAQGEPALPTDAQALPTDAPILQQPVQHGSNSQLQATDQFNVLPDNRPCSHGNGAPMQYWPPGPAGPVGAPGVGGSAGIPGLPGASGAQGARGERGDRGELGLGGVKGDKGDQGLPGAIGQHGPIGLAGQNGTKGQMGEPGQNYTAPPTSAFHFGRTDNILLTSGYQIITFDAERLNTGDDMSTHTGVFTCRIPGLYYFSYTFRAYSSASYGINIDLLLNGAIKSQIYMTAMSKYLMQSQNIILNLTSTDEVWLRANAPTYIYGDPNQNTFTGFLIHAI